MYNYTNYIDTFNNIYYINYILGKGNSVFFFFMSKKTYLRSGNNIRR